MSYRFFDETTANKYAFFRIPKFLVFNENFKDRLSPSAKILYGLMLDRVSLSLNNKWLDKLGHAYIIYTREDIMRDINCSENTAARVLRELQNVGLIYRKAMGFGRPQHIYVMEYIPDSDNEAECKNDTSRGIENDTSRDTNNETSRGVKNDTSRDTEVSKAIPLEAPKAIRQEAPNLHTNNTDMYKTYGSNTDNFSFSNPKAPKSDCEEEADKEMHSKGTAKAQIDSAECEKVVQLYNSTCVSLPKVKAMTEKRKKVISARLKDHDMNELSQAFEMAENSEFLKHGAGTWPGANFDWLMNENNLVKVLEGNYRNGNNNSKNKGSILDNESMNDWEKQMSIREELYGANSELAQLFGTGEIANDYQ